jgi:hypothetical protein
LHHIIQIPLFAVMFDLFLCYVTYFWSVDHHLESEPPENFQDVDFEDVEQRQAGFDGKCA